VLYHQVLFVKTGRGYKPVYRRDRDLGICGVSTIFHLHSAYLASVDWNSACPVTNSEAFQRHTRFKCCELLFSLVCDESAFIIQSALVIFTVALGQTNNSWTSLLSKKLMTMPRPPRASLATSAPHRVAFWGLMRRVTYCILLSASEQRIDKICGLFRL
jgi:hypothetical protein